MPCAQEYDTLAFGVLYSKFCTPSQADLGEGRVVNISSIDLCHIGFLWSTHERGEKCAEQRKERVQPRQLWLKWLKEGECRREEGIVEFIASMRLLIQTERIKLLYAGLVFISGELISAGDG